MAVYGASKLKYKSFQLLLIRHQFRTIAQTKQPNFAKMKLSIVFFAVIAVVLAAPLDDDKNAQVLRYESDNIGIDGYKFE